MQSIGNALLPILDCAGRYSKHWNRFYVQILQRRISSRHLGVWHPKLGFTKPFHRIKTRLIIGIVIETGWNCLISNLCAIAHPTGIHTVSYAQSDPGAHRFGTTNYRADILCGEYAAFAWAPPPLKWLISVLTTRYSTIFWSILWICVTCLTSKPKLVRQSTTFR